MLGSKSVVLGVTVLAGVCASAIAAPAHANAIDRKTGEGRNSPRPLAYSFEWDEGTKAYGPGESDWPATCTNSVGADVCYQPHGDYIWVYDDQADGYSAVARWYTSYGRWGTCQNTYTAGEWVLCNKDFAEGETIHFTATQYRSSTNEYVGDESPEQSSAT